LPCAVFIPATAFADPGGVVDGVVKLAGDGAVAEKAFAPAGNEETGRGEPSGISHRCPGLPCAGFLAAPAVELLAKINPGWGW